MTFESPLLFFFNKLQINLPNCSFSV